MPRYLARRLSEGLITIWVTTLLVFALLRITGNPADFLAPPDMPWADRASLRQAYGLDEPLWKQFLLFHKNVVMGEFGRSLRGTQGEALSVVMERVPATMQLTAAALLVSIILGVPAGVISASRPGFLVDRIGKVVGIAGQSMPVFWVGLLRDLPRIMVAASRESIAKARILGGLHTFRSVVHGIPMVSLLILAVTMICALLAPVLAPHDPIKTNPAKALSAPSLSGHLLGTDHLGRDILSRLIYGARISMTVGFLAVFVAGTVGTLVALVSAVFRGWVGRVLMQITDAFLALPYLMIAVTVIAILEPSLMIVILVIGLLCWMDYARVLRGEVLKLATTDFVHLAIVAGCSRWRIMARHIFPNLINTLLILATLGIGSAVISEATLSFLGLGIPRPQPSWGIMLAESQKYLYTAWWLPLIPGVAVSLLVMASNLVGDWLRDRFDPTRRQL